MTFYAALDVSLRSVSICIVDDVVTFSPNFGPFLARKFPVRL